MAKPGRKSKEQKEETKPVETVGSESKPETITLPKAVEGKPITFRSPEILASRTMLYHPELDPKVFNAGSEIPEGWQRKRVFENFVWAVDGYGKWSKESR